MCQRWIGCCCKRRGYDQLAADEQSAIPLGRSLIGKILLGGKSATFILSALTLALFAARNTHDSNEVVHGLSQFEGITTVLNIVLVLYILSLEIKLPRFHGYFSQVRHGLPALQSPQLSFPSYDAEDHTAIPLRSSYQNSGNNNNNAVLPIADIVNIDPENHIDRIPALTSGGAALLAIAWNGLYFAEDATGSAATSLSILRYVVGAFTILGLAVSTGVEWYRGK